MSGKTFADLASRLQQLRDFHQPRELTIGLYERLSANVEFWRMLPAASMFTGQGQMWPHPLGELTIRHPGGGELTYPAVAILDESPEVLDSFIKLCHAGGVALPAAELERIGVTPDTPPVQRWIAFLLFHLRDERPAFIERNVNEQAIGGPEIYVSIRQPLLASIRAIAKAELDTPAASSKAGALKGGRRKAKQKDRNAKLWTLLADNPNLSVRDAAKLLDTSPASITRSPAWKAHQEKRRQENPPMPDTVDFSPKMEKVAIADEKPSRSNGELLEGLIAEQENDDEGSPLGRAGKGVRIRKRF